VGVGVLGGGDTATDTGVPGGGVGAGKVDEAWEGVLLNSGPKRLLKTPVPTPAGEAA